MPTDPRSRSIKDFFRPSTSKPSKIPPSASPLPKSPPSQQSQPGIARCDPIIIDASAPKSTQAGKRIEYKGHEFVRDSDEDSDESLEDLDVILKDMRSKAPPRAKALPEDLTKRKEGKKQLKYSLDMLLKQAQDNHDRASRLNDIDAKLTEDGTVSHISNETGIEAAEEVLVSLLKDESGDTLDNAKRVTQAMQRTEVLQFEPVFHFFEVVTPLQRSEFPKDCLTGYEWSKSFLDEAKRESAFKSGFLFRIAFLQPLPVEFLQWILDQVCFETREDLISSYLDALESVTKNFPNPLNTNNLQRLFNNLGVRKMSLGHTTIVPEKRLVQNTIRPISPNVRWLFELLTRLAPSLSPPVAEFALHALILLTTDHTIINMGALLFCLSNTISSIIINLPKDPSEPYLNRTITTIFNRVKDPVLRSNILRGLPLHPPRAHLFRRRLALTFALDSTKHTLAPSSLANPALTAHIVLAISESDAYAITSKTDMDFVALAARISTLDTAIDSGFVSRPTSISAEQTQAHDLAIDELTTAVRSLLDNIVPGGGASLISRLEARSAAERLSQRIELAVRITSKGPRNWYAEGDRETNHDLMDKWLTKEPGVSAENEESGAEDSDGDN